jgi:ABC-type transport system involved in multi-copper enzyme maturation permease subunit
VTVERNPLANAISLPLLKHELLGILRSRYAFWMLLLAAALSCAVPLLGWPQSGRRVLYEDNLTLFSAFALAQLSAGMLLVPLFLAGSIAGERERGTLESLCSTPLPPAAIVLSKALAPILYLSLLVALCAPAAALLYLLGGFSMATLLKVYAIHFAAVTSSGIICLSASQKSRTTVGAAVRGLVWVGFWNILLPGFFMPITGVSEGLISFSPHLSVYFAVWHPEFGDIHLISYLLYAGLISAGHLSRLFARARDRFPDLAGSAALESTPAAAASFSPEVAGPTARASRLGERGWPILSNPVFQRETRSEFHGRMWYRGCLFWMILCIFMLIVANFEGHTATVALVAGLALGAIVLLAPIIAAASMTREAEVGNLDHLRGTLLTARQVVAGKYASSLFGTSWILTATCVASLTAALISLLARRGCPLWPIVAPLLLLVAVWLFSTAAGTFVSLLVRRSAGALLLSYSALLGWFLCAPLLWSLLSQGGSELSGLPPFVVDLNPWVLLSGISKAPAAPGPLLATAGSYSGASFLLLYFSVRLFERSWSRER